MRRLFLASASPAGYSRSTATDPPAGTNPRPLSASFTSAADFLMNLCEKVGASAAICFLFGVAVALVMLPQTRTLPMLLALSGAGLAVNIGLLFIVFRDIFIRPFPNPATRYIWALSVFFFLPSVLLYLPRYGFKPRCPHPAGGPDGTSAG